MKRNCPICNVPGYVTEKPSTIAYCGGCGYFRFDDSLSVLGGAVAEISAAIREANRNGRIPLVDNDFVLEIVRRSSPADERSET